MTSRADQAVLGPQHHDPGNIDLVDLVQEGDSPPEEADHQPVGAPSSRRTGDLVARLGYSGIPLGCVGRARQAGGHSHTHRVELPDATVNVDTGFLVYNERTYPLFCRLLDRLGVATQPSDMSFGVSDQRTGLEWRGTSPSTVFAQRRNALRPGFLRMLADIARFNRLALRLLAAPPADDVTLGEVLGQRHWSAGFLEWYLVPLGSSIWSAAPSAIAEIPAATFARFFERHGLLRSGDQPQWRTITGGSVEYVEAVLRPLRREGQVRLGTPVEKIRRGPGGVEVLSTSGAEHFDHVVVATHSHQALRLLSGPDRLERAVLGAIGYQPNRATLHTDARLMPRNRRAWASWNYKRLHPDADRATLTYWVNSLQGIASETPVLVTLNQDDAIEPGKVIARMDYEHPVLGPATCAAQRRHGEINGMRRTWFCGAYWGHGFHEDGVRSAVEACSALGVVL
jgi:predicted NAD/FAD-binding protein